MHTTQHPPIAAAEHATRTTMRIPGATLDQVADAATDAALAAGATQHLADRLGFAAQETARAQRRNWPAPENDLLSLP